MSKGNKFRKRTWICERCNNPFEEVGFKLKVCPDCHKRTYFQRSLKAKATNRRKECHCLDCDKARDFLEEHKRLMIDEKDDMLQ